MLLESCVTGLFIAWCCAVCRGAKKEHELKEELDRERKKNYERVQTNEPPPYSNVS